MALSSEAVAPAASEAMMTLESLRVTEVNFDIAKEALVQAEKRLGDALEAKKVVEQKATALFGAYVTLSLALFGFGGTLARDVGSNAWPVFVAGMLFVAGAAAFAHVFRGGEYGNLGSQPSMWLQSGRIDGGKDAFARMIAYVTFHHDGRIRASYDSNAAKNRSLNCGLAMGLVGALALLAAMLFIFYGFATGHP